METESSLRRKTLDILYEIAHYHLMARTRLLLDVLACYEKQSNPGQPRVPAGNPDGGQWTSDEGSAKIVSPVDRRH